MAEETRNENTESVNRNTGAFNRLNQAIDGLGSMVGSIVRGAPQAMAPIMAAAPGMKMFADSMAFAEGYISIWQGLTRSGIHFNNEIDQMILGVGRANLRIEDFAKIVQQNNIEFAAMGGTANAGAQAFLSAQAAFMAESNGLFNEQRIELERLGYTSQTLSETFASFDSLATIQGIRSRMNERERNLAAAEYAKTLDELARLTGKQTDALAEEQAEISRQGNVFAFGQMLDQDVRDELDNGLLALRQVAPSVKDFAVDILTRGFPNMDDPEMRALNAAAPGLRDALMEARQAFLDGDETRAQMLMDAALGEATQLRNNQFLIRQAMLGSATEISQGSMNIMTELSSGLALSGDVIRAKALEMFPETAPEDLSGDQIAQAMDAIITEERRNQTSRTSQSQQLLDQYLSGIRQLQSVAMSAQEAVVNGIFNTLTAAADRFVQFIEGRDVLGDILATIEGPIGDAARAFHDTNSQVMATVAASTQLQRDASLFVDRMNTLGFEATDVDQMTNIIDDLSNKTQEYARDTSNTALKSEIDTLTAALRTIMDNSNFNPSAPNPNSLSPEQLQEIRNMMSEMNPNRNFGSLGTVGRLFENFGKSTAVNLHGLEAVVTPDQMASIVESSALGAIRSLSASLSDTTTNTTGMLDGMLNTIRTLPTEMASIQPSSTETNTVERTMQDMAMRLRGPLEEAMNNTLVPKLEELVAVNQRSAQSSDKIRRGIGNLGTDMLRSV